MKFPSVKTLAQSAAKTVKRFPFEVLFALAGTIACTVTIQVDKLSPDNLNWCHRVMMTANLGLLLCLATSLFIESRGFAEKKGYMIKIVVALAAASLLFILNPDERLHDYLRFFLFSLGFHLLVSFAAFVTKGHVQGFWQFNKVIFLRFLTSVLYSGVLFLGLLAAINATIFLFNLHFDYRIDVTLFTWIAGIFNTLFFLAGVPEDTAQLDDDFSYPKGLKVFTQYVLIPLATVYVLILLAYETKILMQWHMPKGLVSNLILGYAVFGILSILLVYPIREQQENKWIKTYARSFYFLLIPLIILLFLAVLARVVPYGITEARYFLLILALWLTFITVYFLFSKKQNIKIIPISLCIVTLISIYGPLSAFTVSRFSQRHILISLFEKYGKYKDGKLIPMGNKKMSPGDGTEAASKLEYLVDGKNMSALQGYINKDLAAVNDSLRKQDKHTSYDYFYNQAIKEDETTWITTYLGVDKFADKTAYAGWINYNFYIDSDNLLNVKGYDYVAPVDDGFSNTDTTFLKNSDIGIKQLSDTGFNCELYLNNELAVFDLKQIADSLIKHEDKLKPFIKDVSQPHEFSLPADMLIEHKQTSTYNVAFAIDKLNVNYKENKVVNVSEVHGYYLIKKK